MTFHLNSFRFAAPGPTDPYFGNVVLLTTGDGANASTTFPNLVGNPDLLRTVTSAGICELSNTRSEYGTCSLKIDNTGGNAEALSNESSAYALGTQYTIEFTQWLVAANATSTFRIIQGPSGASPGAQVMKLQSWVSGANIWFDWNVTGGSTCSTGAYNQPINTWLKTALVQTATHMRMYFAGTLIQAVATTPNLTQIARIGLGLAGTHYFSNIRVTKGVARYTGASYTPETAAFPTS